MTLSVNAGQRATAASINEMVMMGVVKPGDQSLTSNTTLQDDNDLVLPVVAGASYVFKCYLDYEGGTQGSSDIKWQWAIPSGALLRYQPLYVGTTGNIAGGTTLTAGSTGIAGSNGAGVLMGVGMKGGLIVAATAGNLQLTWAQNTSSGTPTIVHACSAISLTRTA